MSRHMASRAVPKSICTRQGCVFVTLGARLATVRISRTASTGTGTEVKPRTLRREVMAASTTAA